MAILLAACVTSFLVCIIILPVIIRYTTSKNMLDVPGRRKIHKKVTPSLGGIGIFGGFLMAILVWLSFDNWSSVHYVIASMFLMFLLGVRDDIVPFRAFHKLFGQIVAVIILLFSSVRIGSFYGLFGITEIPLALVFFLTGFTVLLVTNSFNLIDGLDGLAGSVGLIALIAFGVWFYLAGDDIFALVAFAMIGGILAFLVFNWEPSEIFMGDTGAMVIGMLLAVMAIHFMSVNDTLADSNPVKFATPVSTAVCFIIVPLCDTTRIIILRLMRGQSPFAPDKSHIHHAIMRLGMTHSQTAMILAVVNTLFIIAAFIFRDSRDEFLLIGVIIAAGVLSFIVDKLIVRKTIRKTT